MTGKESPDYVKISTAPAMTLKFYPGRFNRGEKLRALNLLVIYDGGKGVINLLCAKSNRTLKIE